MKWFRDLRIAAKLLTVVVALLGALVFLGAFAVLQLARVNATSTDIEVNWLPSVRFLGQIEATAGAYRRYELLHILSTTDADMDLYEKKVADTAEAQKKIEDEYQKVITSEEERQMYREFRGLWTASEDLSRRVLALDRRHQNADGRELNRGEGLRAYEAAMGALQRDLDLNQKGAVDASHHGDELYAASRALIWGLVVLCVVGGFVLALLVARVIRRGLESAVAIAERLSTGDMTVSFGDIDRDEVGRLLSAMKVMTSRLTDVVVEVRGSADNVASGALQLSSSSEQLSQGATEQASSVEEVSSSMEQMSSNI